MEFFAVFGLALIVPFILPLHVGHGNHGHGFIHQWAPRFLLRYVTKYEAFAMRVVQYATTRDWIMKQAWAANFIYWVSRMVLKVVNGEVLTLEETLEVVAGIADHGYLIAVGTCPCRRARNKFSDHLPNNTDMVFGKWAEEYLHNYPDCYEVIDKEEALRLVREFDHHGFVHNLYGIPVMRDAAYVVCNCAPDVCVPLRVHCEFGYPAFSRGRSLAMVDSVACLGGEECGACFARCPFNARKAGADGKSTVDPDTCHGCGVCRETCRGEATRMERKPGARLIFARNLVDRS
jgi:NAD-dependent dihydropyrimidine dehydrogenase PreA subunit